MNNSRPLLRLKRHEQPPPGYYDQLLHSVHRRQRAELLQRPLWKIAVERWQTFFSVHSMGSLSYAGAMAGVLVAGVLTVSVLTPLPRGESQPVTGSDTAQTLAATAASATAGPLTVPSQSTETTTVRARSATMPDVRFADASVTSPGFVMGAPEQPRHQPRYVIDARPVSYAPSLSF